MIGVYEILILLGLLGISLVFGAVVVILIVRSRRAKKDSVPTPEQLARRSD